jgi:predicted dehydrogenase
LGCKSRKPNPNSKLFHGFVSDLSFFATNIFMQKPVRTLISAFGMSGKVFHGPLLSANSGFEISGIVQRSKVDSKDYYPDAQVFTNLQDAILNLTPDLVIVNTPPHLHFEETKLALEMGCHVVVEKPFATSLSEAEILIKLAEQKAKMLTAFQNRRWDSDFLTVKKLKDSGILGKWNHFESYFNRYRPEVENQTWKEEQQPGSGLVWNLGPHLIDQALQLFGFPDAVTAFIRNIRPGAMVEDAFHIVLHYPDLVAELKSSYLVPDFGLKYKIQGDLFSFQKDGMDIQESQLKSGKSCLDSDYGVELPGFRGTIRKLGLQGLELEFFENEPGNYMAFYDAVFDCIRYGGKPPVLTSEILQVLRVIEAVFESNSSKTTICF